MQNPRAGKLGLRKEKVLSLRKALTLSETAKECMKMSNNSNNQLNIPETREAMDRFKMQAAQDDDVLAASSKLMQRNKHVYEELAK